MKTFPGRFLPYLVVAFALMLTLGSFAVAYGAPTTYLVTLSGANQSPPNASPGTGSGTVVTDPVLHTMTINLNFSGLTAGTTAAHIHAATTTPLTGTAGVATTTPSFAGFPLGVTAEAFIAVLDMTLSSSYNSAYLNNAVNLGSTATAEASLFQAIAEGRAYFNIHTQSFPGGEIRGFLLPQQLATDPATWGKIKALYR